MINIPEDLKTKLKANDDVKKNIIVHFPNGENDDLTNESLLAESLVFTESIMSRDTMKFGLCEGNHIEFDAINLSNVKGATIEVVMQIDYRNIRLGTFVIDECKKDANNLNIRHISAYSSTSYDDWKWNKFFKLFMESYSWRTAEDFYLSFNDLKKIQFTSYAVENKTRDWESLSNWEGVETAPLSYGYAIGNTYYTVMLYCEYVYFDVSRLGDWLLVFDCGKISKENENEIDYTIKSFVEQRVKRIDDLSDISNKIAEDLFYQFKKLIISYNTYIHYRIPEGYIRITNSNGIKQGTANYKTGDIILDFGYNNVPVPNNYEMGSTYSYSSIGDVAAIKFKNISIEIGKTDITSGQGEIILPRMDIPIENIVNLPSCKYTYMDIEHHYATNGIVLKPKKITKRVVYNNESAKTGKTTRTDYVYELPESIRDIFEGNLELNGDFGRINRDGEYEELSLGADWLYPSDDLFPDSEVYPGGSDPDIGFELYTKKMYSRCYTEDEPTKLYGMVSTTYTNEDNEQDTAFVYIVPENEYNEEIYQSYDISNNYLIKNNKYSQDAIIDILTNLGNRIKNIQYTPFELDCIGLPYVEAGDRVNILTDEGTVDSYVLRRTLSGIQNLKDSFESN